MGQQRTKLFFEYNPVNFVEDKYKKDTLAKKWKVYAKAPRIRREKIGEYWDYKPVDVNQKFTDLFTKWGFENPKSEDLKEDILRKREDSELEDLKEFDGKRIDFWHSFIYLFNLILQTRNSFSLQIKTKEGKIEKIKESVDFIASPVWPFFSTGAINEQSERLSDANFDKFENRFVGSAEEKRKFVDSFNGDANGAYNIARKGIMILEKIKKNPEKPDLFISKSDWDEWASENGIK